MNFIFFIFSIKSIKKYNQEQENILILCAIIKCLGCHKEHPHYMKEKQNMSIM